MIKKFCFCITLTLLIFCLISVIATNEGAAMCIIVEGRDMTASDLVFQCDNPNVYIEKPVRPTQEFYTNNEINMLAQLVYAEARGANSRAEKAAVIWCVLNRVDSERFDNTIHEVITARHQFAYWKGLPILPEYQDLAVDVLNRWVAEKNGEENVGRTLPKEYLYFCADGWGNKFSIEWQSGIYWDWSLPSPYEH